MKVVITGAAGQIAYQLIFSLLKGEVFGDEKISLSLIDISASLSVLEGVVMEIEDCAFTRLESVSIHADTELEAGFKDADFVFLVGASPRKEGMERSDLLVKNGEIFKQQGQMLSKVAKPTVKVLVVGNPCNTNCLIAMRHAKNIPNTQFFAMTMLDEHRARYQLAKHDGLDIEKTEVFIYGNHSATQYPDFEQCAKEPNDDWFETTFVPMIQTRGAEVISQRGASSAASAAHAAIKTAYYLVNPSDQVFSVASCSQGEYDSPEGMIVSMPHVHTDQIAVKEGFSHSEKAKQWMQASYDELLEEYAKVEELGLLDD